MSVKLAKTAGFCMGVKRAVDMVLDMAQERGSRKFYTFGPLIHNPQTIELLEKRGIIPLKRIEDIDPHEKEATIIIRAHGISPEERRLIKERGLKIVDATCPKVGRVQAIIKKHAALGYRILIIGDPEHPEVNGLLGYASDRGYVITDEKEVDALPDVEKVCVVAQTTQSHDEFERIVEHIKARFSDTLVFNTICDSTEKRQTEVKELATEMDAMVIVGGRNSANTMRLAGLAGKEGTPTHQIETVDELAGIDLSRYENIGVSAGASTPNWIIDRVVEGINAIHDRKQSKFHLLYRVWLFAVKTDLYAAAGAACLAFVSMLMQKIDVQNMHILTTALFVFAMHTLNRVINRRSSSIPGSFREELYQRHTGLYVFIAVLSMIAALVFSFLTSFLAFAMLGLLSVCGMLYNKRIMPAGWRFESFSDIPGSKNVFMAAAWAVVAAVLPQIDYALSAVAEISVAFLFVFSVVFIRSAMSDMLDIQSDKLIGRETIPVLIGKDRTQKLLKLMLALLLVLLLAAYPLGWSSSVNIVLLICLFYIWICFRLCDRRSGLSGIVLEGLLETSYVVAGAGALLWLVYYKTAT